MEGGKLRAPGASLGWTLDGGAVYLYDIEGDSEGITELIDAANALAGERFAAVLSVELHDDDPAVPLLRGLGFEEDWHDPDVRAGQVVRRVGLVRTIR